MGNTYRYTQSRLPVALVLVGSEIAVPSRYAVKFGENALITVLMGGGLRLFCSCKFVGVTEQINSGKSETSVRTHRLAQSGGLTGQGGFLHHMSREGNAVFFAPGTHGIRKGTCKKFRYKIVVSVSVEGGGSVF